MQVHTTSIINTENSPQNSNVYIVVVRVLRRAG